MIGKLHSMSMEALSDFGLNGYFEPIREYVLQVVKRGVDYKTRYSKIHCNGYATRCILPHIWLGLSSERECFIN